MGQVLLGQSTKGFVMLVVSVVLCGGLGLLPILAALDAWILAERRQSRMLGEWEFFWSES